MKTQTLEIKQTDVSISSSGPIKSVSVVKTGTTDAHEQHFHGSKLNPL
jgi:hypothetical protein